MKRKLVLVISVVLSLATATELPARTWTEAATGRTIQADYVESDTTHVVLKKGDRTYKIAIARLSDAGKAFIKEQSAKLSQALAPAADLESQLIGYWAPDSKKTLDMADKEDLEIVFFAQKLLPKMTFEFQKGKMIVHGPPGNKAVNPPDLYTVKGEDKTSNTLTLEWQGGKPESTATIMGDQLTLKRQSGTIVFNRISQGAFAKRHVPSAPTLEDVTEAPIPATPAEGKVHGVDFKVEKATLQYRHLTLGQGKDFFADQEFKIYTSTRPDEPLDGRTFLVKPNDGPGGGPQVTLSYKVEGSRLREKESFFDGFAMKLEFGTASDGKIPGKIHLRVPDKAKSFVVGTFEAEVK